MLLHVEVFMRKLYIWMNKVHHFKQLTTGKIEKVDSHHVPAIKFIGKKQLVEKVPIIL